MTPAMTVKQRETFRLLAAVAAQQSDDPSTQNAAGYPRLNVYAANRLPFMIRPTHEERERLKTDRDWKLAVMEHAERAAIFEAGSDHTESLYALWLACPDCARAIVQASTNRTVYSLEMPAPERWGKRMELGDWILARGGIEHVRFPLDSIPGGKLGVTILFDGKPLEL